MLDILKLNKRSDYFYTILIVIIFFFSFDFISKLLLVYDYEGFTRYSAIPKILLEVVLIVILVKNYKKNYLGILYCLVLVGIVSLSFFLTNDKSDASLFQKIYSLNKFLYLFIFAEAMLSLKKDNRMEVLYLIRNLFIIVGITNSIFILMGMFFDFEIFRSYRYTNRFGYNGFFVKTSETSYLYILLLITSYYEYIKTYKKTKLLLMLYFVFISLLIGTKAVWMFLVLLIFIHFVFNKKSVIRYFSIFGIIIITFLSFLFDKEIINIIVNSFSFGPSLYAERGFFSVLTSTRDLLMSNAYLYVQENWNWINYLFGGIDFFKYEVEFEFVDLFLFFGSVGLIVYLLFLKRVFFSSYIEKYKVLLFIALLLVTAFAGNFFKSIICSLLAYVVFYSMENANRDY